MKKFLTGLAWLIGVIVGLIALDSADTWLKTTLILGGLIVCLYIQLSKQIAENHKKVTAMFDNTYRAVTGQPRDDN